MKYTKSYAKKIPTALWYFQLALAWEDLLYMSEELLIGAFS